MLHSRSNYILIGAILTSFTCAAQPAFSGMRYLDNGVIRIGMNLDIGGAITHLGPSGSDENIVNSHDWGRQIQMSFYSGPVPFAPEGVEMQEMWRGLGWNPIQSGDTFGNQSRVIAFSDNNDTLYVKCIPMHWPLNNRPGECTFETWIALDGNTAKVRSQLNNARTDKTVYPARGQELPAIYTNGPYYRLFTYDGNEPFTNAPLRRITKVWDTSKGLDVEGGPWDSWYATENWAALVRDDNWGVGVWSPGSYRYSGGFAGKPGAGGPKDAPTGYIAPIRREILDANIVYTYGYTLIVGQLEEIREYVYQHADKVRAPNYVFSNDRQGWTIRGGTDQGWPIDGAWEINLENSKGRLAGPLACWNTSDVPRILVRAEVTEGVQEIGLLWECVNDEGQTVRGGMSLPAKDGMQTYTFNLAGARNYAGSCRQLSIMPGAETNEHWRVRFESIVASTAEE